MSGAPVAPAGQGAPLEAGARDAIASSFRHDFSQVRVHVGPDADAAARALDATAYTVGNDIVFRDGAYDPLSARGRSLLAHELAHVAQHGGRAHAPNFRRAVPPAPASARLERQADAAAALHTHGLPQGWAWERAVEPFVGRVGPNWTNVATPYTVEYAGERRRITREEWMRGNDTSVRVSLGAFVLPSAKAYWTSQYDNLARTGLLQTVVRVDGTAASALHEESASTSVLWNMWLRRVGWPTADAVARRFWFEAGGNRSPAGAFEPKVGGKTVDVDHIVERQLGGANVQENLAPTESEDNQEAGRTIWAQISAAARDVKEQLAAQSRGDAVEEVTLHFTTARAAGNVPRIQPLRQLSMQPAARATALEARRASATSAIQVHLTAIRDLEQGTRPSNLDDVEADTGTSSLQPYPLAGGPNATTVRVGAAATGSDDLEGSNIPENANARELIAGMTLSTIERTARREYVVAFLPSASHQLRGGSTFPNIFSGLTNAQARLELDVTDPRGTGRLRLHGRKRGVRFTYPYLSTGEMDLDVTNDGIIGHGTLTPSVPLLSRVPITVDLDRTGLHGSVAAPKDRLSLPPFRVTDAALTVDIGERLAAGGHVDFELGRLVTGRIEASVDSTGFLAAGQVTAHVPGLDEATGRVEYRPATGLTGFVVVSVSGRSGLVTGGEARVDFANRSWTASGRIDLALPGGSPARLTMSRRGENVLYTGSATLAVPGLHPVDVELSYDGEHVAGSAHTTFTLLGANGDIALRYRDGRFSGDGSVRLQRGRFTGSLDARLDEQGRISGRGQGSIELRPGLVGTVGVEYAPDHHLHVTGELRFPPYRFLEPRGNRYQLFQHDLPDIPLFAIPLGVTSVGLVARIGGGLAVRYSFGPGEIRDMVIRAQLDPLEDDPNMQIEAEARLVLPAEAGLEMSVRAAIGVSAAIASATGGITVTGGVLLRGGLDASARIAYAHSLVTFDAQARISVQPVLTLAIDADFTLEATGIGQLRYPYNLAAYSYPTGLEFGMVAPFHYRSDQPLRLPEASDIQWIVPQIDVGALTDRIAGRVRAGLGL